MGKEFSKNIRFVSTSGSRPHSLRVRRQAHSRRHHARRSPPVGTPRILCPFRMDKEAAIAMRKSVIEQVKQQGLTMFGMHFPTTEGIQLK